MASIKMATIDWRLVTVVAFLWSKNTEKPRVGNVTDNSSCAQLQLYINLSVFSSGAARGGPGLPQVVHQSPVQVSFESSEESENHAV